MGEAVCAKRGKSNPKNGGGPLLFQRDRELFDSRYTKAHFVATREQEKKFMQTVNLKIGIEPFP